MKTQSPYKLPRLFPKDADMDKYWFVHFDYLNPETGKFQRFKEYSDLNRIPNKRERLKKAEAMKATITQLLLNGYNPFENVLPEQEPEKAPEKPRTNLKQALEKALNEKCVGIARKTAMAYRGKAAQLFAYIKEQGLEKRPPEAFKQEHAREVLQWLMERRGVTPYTRNTYLIMYKSLFSILVDMEIIVANPFYKVKRLKAQSESCRPFSAQQVAELRMAMQTHDPQLFYFTQFIFYAFIRPNELRLLQVKHVNLKDRLIHIPGLSMHGERISKTKARYVEICASLADLLTESDLLDRPADAYLFPSTRNPQQPNGSNTMYHRHQGILKAYGYQGDKYTLYGWKHSGVIAAYLAGLDILTIQQMCGHTAVDMTYRYLRKIGLLRSDAAREKRW
jgi:integrase